MLYVLCVCVCVWLCWGWGWVGRTVVFDERLHVLLDALVPLCDVHMEGVVKAGLTVRPLTPLLKG